MFHYETPSKHIQLVKTFFCFKPKRAVWKVKTAVSKKRREETVKFP